MTARSLRAADGEAEPRLSARAPGGRALRFGLVAVTIFFPLSVAGLIFHYAVDVPVEDQWSTLLLLGRYLDGEMTLAEWLSPHREHRLLVPRLLWFPLARATGWNLRVEVAVGYSLVLLTFSILALQIARWPLDSVASDRRSLLRWTMFSALALTLFGWQPWENWLWGSQIQTFASILFVVIGLHALTVSTLDWRWFSVAVAATSFALYSQATAFAAIAVGAVILLLRALREARGARRAPRPLFYLVLWGVLGVAHAFAYRAGDLADAGPVTAALHHPLDWLAYSLVFLGGPLVAYGKALHPFGPIGPGVIAGLLSLGLFLGAAAHRPPRAEATSGNRRFVLALGAYAIGVSLLTGLGRVDEGVGQAYASRYTSYSLLLWLSILLLYASAIEPATRARARARRSLAIVVMVSGALLASSLGSLPLYHRVHDFLADERAQLRRSPRQSSALNSDQALIDRGVEILKRHRLSVFRDP